MRLVSLMRFRREVMKLDPINSRFRMVSCSGPLHSPSQNTAREIGHGVTNLATAVRSVLLLTSFGGFVGG